jgi:transglutaminase-like putative cysteine protease
MTARFLGRLGVAALAAAMAWIALWSWNDLVEQPGRFLSPALFGGVLLVTVGGVGRTLRWPWYAVLPAQLVVLSLWLNHKYAEADSTIGWVPTMSSIKAVAERIQDGAVAINTYSSPVSSEHPETYAYLLATALLVMLSTDFLACGLRRVPWAGLPVIVTLTVPISVLESGLSWVVFVTTALLFMMLLATEETERVLSWGRSIAGRGERIDSLDQVVNGSTVRGSAFRIGLLTAAGALVIPIFVPVSSGLINAGGGPGSGSGGGGSVTLKNPIVDLQRDLLRQDDIPLVRAETAADPTYLRLTVLDEFDGSQWQPSDRDLVESNKAIGPLPPAPGLAPDATGAEEDWNVELTDDFDTTWLPTPYPATRINIGRGDWRYDGRTLDIAKVDKTDTSGLNYRVTGFTPELSPAELAGAVGAPVEVLGPMTRLPRDMPDVIAETARAVTAGARSNYDRMALLQAWFRSNGGFSYSLDRGPGSGMTQLARFITEEKVGYCEQYAAAMAVMARTLGIASRVVVGFLSPQGEDGSYVYTTDDLHAWPEMYFTGFGWVRFEPTPSSRTGTAPPWTIGGVRSPTTGGPTDVPTQAPTAVDPTENVPGTTGSENSSSDGTTAAAWGVGVLLLLGALAVPRVARNRQRRRRLGSPDAEEFDAHDLASGAWEEVCAVARDLGISLPLHRSVREISAVLRHRAYPGTDAVRRLDELTDFVERARYGRPFKVDAETRGEIAEAVEMWSNVLAESVAKTRARVAKVFPRSLLDREAPSGAVDRQMEWVGAREVH